MIRKLLAVSCFIFLFSSVHGQTTAGKDFWVAFLESDITCLPPPRLPLGIPLWDNDTLELYLSSPHAATVYIEVKQEKFYGSGSDTDYYDTVHLKPNIGFRRALPPRLCVHGIYSDYTTKNGVHIYSDSNITVAAVNRYANSKGSTMVMPVEAIPYSPEYFVTTNHSDNSWDCYPSSNWLINKSPQFAIVGIAQRSVIEVIPTAISTTRKSKVGVPFVLVLYQGETFGYVANVNDLTGCIIRSRDANSKFAVFTGNRQTFSQQLNASNTLCKSTLDHTYEQVFPTVTWGVSYTALPLKNNLGGYYIKIVSAEDSTRVNINGKFYGTLKQGGFFTYNVSKDTATRITANKRIQVTQFALGTGCNLHPAPKTSLGDVSQMQLIPDLQTSTSATINWLNTGNWYRNGSSTQAPENYVNVMVKTADTAQFRMNGKAVINALWKSGAKIPGYSYAQITLDTAVYNLQSSKGFIAYAYGYGVNDGYAYAASANFKMLQNNFFLDYQCLHDTTTLTALKNDSFSNYSWNPGDKSGIKNGSKVKLLYKDTGWYRVVMYCKQIRTNAVDSIVKWIYIDDAKSKGQLLINDTIICGKVEFNVFSKTFHDDYDYIWNDGHPYYYREIGNPGQYWERVTERNGCTYVDTLNVIQYQNPVASFSQSDSIFCANKIKPIAFRNNSTAVDTIVFNEWDFGDQVVLDSHKIVNHLYKNANLWLVHLQVKTNKGCTDDTFKFVEIKKAPKATFTMSATDTCFGSSQVSFTNTTVIDSAVHMRYKWHFSDSFVLSNSNPTEPRNYGVAGQQYAELIYENWNGCIDTMKKFITIYAAPKPVFTFKSNFSCSNDSLRTINTTTTQYKPLTTIWDFGDKQQSTLYSPAHKYAKKGTYNVKLVTKIPQGCKDSAIKQVTIYGAPKADFSINDDIQCLAGNDYKFKNTSTVDTGNFPIRIWSSSDGSGDKDIDSFRHVFTTAGNKTVKLKVSGIFGCLDSIVKTVYVKAAPSAQFVINDKSQCIKNQNFTFTYTDLLQNDTLAAITWYYYDDSAKNKKILANIKFPYVQSYNVKLKLRTIYGCEGELMQKIFVNPNPIAQFKVPRPLQCLNGNAFTPVHFSSIATGSTITGFNWNYGDNTLSNVESPAAKTYAASGTYKILLTVFSDSGCTDTTSNLVRVRANADITILPVAETCLNDTTELNGNATITDGSIRKYQWNFGDNSGTDTIVNPKVKHIYKTAGVYPLTLTTISNYNCVDSKTVPAWVTVNTLPNAAFGYDIKDGGNRNSLIAFKDLTQPVAFKRLWDFGQYGQSGLKDTTVSIVDTTTIHAKLYVTNSQGCTGMIEKVIFLAPPGEMYFPEAFTANGDGLNDGFGPVGIMYATNYKFTIYNRWGEMVFKSNALGETWDGTYDGTKCQNGFYVYKLELNDFYGKYKKYEGTVLLMW